MSHGGGSLCKAQPEALPHSEPDGGFLDLARSDDPADMERIPREMRGFFKAFSGSIHRMNEQDRTAHLGGEHSWEAHCGEEAYLTYFDLQCYGEQTVKLPADKVYKAELIDVWNMTREVIAENISGDTKLALPGRDNLALLITRIQSSSGRPDNR